MNPQILITFTWQHCNPASLSVITSHGQVLYKTIPPHVIESYRSWKLWPLTVVCLFSSSPPSGSLLSSLKSPTEPLVFVARFAFSSFAPEHQSHDSTRSQLACSLVLQLWSLGSCRHMALFCLMTVCVAESRKDGVLVGRQIVTLRLKGNKLSPKACMPSEAQRENLHDTLTFLHCFCKISSSALPL